MIFFLPSTLSLDDANQPLTLTRFADRHHQTSAQLELRNQRIRNSWATRGDENRVVRSVCCPAECTVKTFYGGVVNSKLSNSRLCFARQLTDSFNRVNLCGNLC